MHSSSLSEASRCKQTGYESRLITPKSQSLEPWCLSFARSSGSRRTAGIKQKQRSLVDVSFPPLNRTRCYLHDLTEISILLPQPPDNIPPSARLATFFAFVPTDRKSTRLNSSHLGIS